MLKFIEMLYKRKYENINNSVQGLCLEVLSLIYISYKEKLNEESTNFIINFLINVD